MHLKNQQLHSIVTEAARGDTRAQQQLVELLQQEARAHVRTMINSHGLNVDADEVLNEIWRDLLENLHKFNTEDFRLWFAARRVWRFEDYLRRQVRTERREKPFPDPEECSAPESSSAYTDVHRQVVARELLDRINSLPRRQRIVLSLYHLHGCRYQEIAEELNIRPESVSKIHHRARKKLRKLCGPDLFFE